MKFFFCFNESRCITSISKIRMLRAQSFKGLHEGKGFMDMSTPVSFCWNRAWASAMNCRHVTIVPHPKQFIEIGILSGPVHASMGLTAHTFAAH